jgi:hypothetical protein
VNRVEVSEGYEEEYIWNEVSVHFGNDLLDGIGEEVEKMRREEFMCEV